MADSEEAVVKKAAVVVEIELPAKFNRNNQHYLKPEVKDEVKKSFAKPHVPVKKWHCVLFSVHSKERVQCVQT